MIFLFLSNTRSLFPLIFLLLSLSLSLYIYTSFHIFSQIVGSLWLEADRIDCLMASFPCDVRRFIVRPFEIPRTPFVWYATQRYHLRFIFTFPVSRNEFNLRMILMDRLRLLGIRKELEILFLIGGISDWEAVLFCRRRSKLFKGDVVHLSIHCILE